MLTAVSPVLLTQQRSITSAHNMQQQIANICSGNSSSAGSSGLLSSYSEQPQLGLDVEFGADPASGAFFQPNGRKHEDLKQMLDSNKDGLKLEAMKRLIGMIARGRDASDLFPAVVKNVVSKNIEVKKLVYVYLVRYAEEQQDLALLSISTFQRALKDPNQLIRASALRVLSSIRVGMIVPIVMLAIRDSASDMSAYVRKTAAHAIPKLYSLDAEQKEELVTVIEKLLSDRTTLVVGSAVMAFEEVCPERVDLIHKNYRKLCNLLVDVDEWGQVIIINMLTRYARTQFTDPNIDELEQQDDMRHAHAEQFYDESSGSTSNHSNSDNDENKADNNKQRSTASSSAGYHVDLDHRMLLRQAKPLLQSRNASVVMAVAQLYHHMAPRNEVQLIAKALIRLLRSHKEVQSVVLTCIASMSTKRKCIFEPHIKSFFVRTSDPTHIKLLKLDILTNLGSAASIPLILREFQTYISSSDRSFVAATIQAIGRCAASIKAVTETCLNGLVHLLSNRDEHVVAESVVVIKKLLQNKSAEHCEIITQMAKLLDFITVPAARASIIWLIGEYNTKVPKIAPDVLRKIAKTFVDEENIVKLQVLNLAVKLYLSNAAQTSLVCQYVFTLARYDPNYDIRDRARFLQQFVFPANGKSTVLSQSAHKIFLSSKPAPALESKHRERDQFQLGSLSHYLNMRTHGYNDLPAFPAVAPDATVRNIEGFMFESSSTSHGNIAGAGSSSNKATPDKKPNKIVQQKKNSTSGSEKSSVYSDTDSSSDSDSDSSSSDSDNSSSSSNNSSKSKNEQIKQSATKARTAAIAAKDTTTKKTVEGNTRILNDKVPGDSDSAASTNYATSSSVSGSSDSEATAGSETESEKEQKRNFERAKQKAANATVTATNAEQLEKKSDMDLLLDLDDIPPIGPVMTPSLGGFLTPGTAIASTLLPQNAANRIDLVGPSYIEFQHKQLLNKLNGHGLQLNYRFTRSPHLYSSTMVSIELQFSNQTAAEITSIEMIEQPSLPAGMQLNAFAPIQSLLPQQTSSSILGVDFNDSTQAIELEIKSSAGKSRITLKPSIGELIRAVQFGHAYFQEERNKLRGMNEHQANVQLLAKKESEEEDWQQQAIALKQCIFECINVAQIHSVQQNVDEHVLYFAGQTMNSKSLVLITLDYSKLSRELTIMVNCEKMVIGSMVLNELRNAFASALK